MFWDGWLCLPVRMSFMDGFFSTVPFSEQTVVGTRCVELQPAL